MSAISNEPFTPRTTEAIKEAISQPATVYDVRYQRIRLRFKADDVLRILGKDDFVTWVKESAPYYLISSFEENPCVDLYVPQREVGPILQELSLKGVHIDLQCAHNPPVRAPSDHLWKSDVWARKV